MDPKLIVFGLLAFVILSGCARTTGDDTAYQASLGKEFQLRPGEMAEIHSEKLFVKFLNVTEDSRCPENVVCIWEGQATVEISFQRNGRDFGKFNLTSRAGQPKLAAITVDGYSVRLVSVELPYGKKAGYEYSPGDYIAKFEVVSLG